MSILPLLTSSRLKVLRSCAREDHYRYQLGYRSTAEDREALELGDLVHTGLEAWWLGTGKVAGQQLQGALDAIRANRADPFQQARAEALLIGYHARWVESRSDYEVIAVEVKFGAPLVNPDTGAESKTFAIGGKIDALVRERGTGRALVIEHKTSSEDVSPGSFYWRRLRMDGQVIMYFAGGATLGHDIQGCLYDVLGKPGLRPAQVPVLDGDGAKIVLDQTGARVRTKDGKKWRQTGDTEQGYVLQTRPETPEEFRARLLDAIGADPERYYQRGEVVRLEGELREAEQDRWQQAQQLRDNVRLGRHPRNVDACLRYGAACDFFDVCTGTASLTDPLRFRRVEWVHSELAGSASAPSREETAP